MKTIKVIDLLNKIANEEKVPKKVKYDRRVYEYQEGGYDYLYYVENNGTMIFLLTELFNSSDNILDILSYEIEIIEEDKEIEPLDVYTNAYIKNEMSSFYEHNFEVTVKHNFEVINKKINELVKAVNSIKKGN